MYTFIGILLIVAVTVVVGNVDNKLNVMLIEPARASVVDDDIDKITENLANQMRELRSYEENVQTATELLDKAIVQYNEATERYAIAVDSVNLHMGTTNVKDIVEHEQNR